ncbi:hypothetical protein BJV78DRAFT_1257719 [Lactifluus subvellereus]|nr:hypothetical protein BJV78DRAFT_1257719 [Lactifluus subvellereus]
MERRMESSCAPAQNNKISFQVECMDPDFSCLPVYKARTRCAPWRVTARRHVTFEHLAAVANMAELLYTAARRFNLLQKDSDPQTYGFGVKEVWRAGRQYRPGRLFTRWVGP